MNVEGLTVEKGVSAAELVKGFKGVGFQARELAKAVEVVKEMKENQATVFLSFTSNMVSSGLRELFAQLCREKFVDVIVTSIGSVEEDYMKCFAPFELGSFNADDVALHEEGTNRIGDVLVKNGHYELLEKNLKPFFDAELAKQKEFGRLLAPNELIRDLGLTMSDENSFVYWAARNRIPVACPSPTDGAFGLQMFFYSQEHPEFGVDAAGDMKQLAPIVLSAEKTGGILLGGGAAKHFCIGANLLRGGLDYAVYVTTATPFDGSLSGARVNEAVSWGKVKEKAATACVQCDATIAFPLIIAGVKG
ncbi:deoxyhypusine synthase [Candidatus Micrarchaeota archaeon CG_4_10_14_0_2_um_filter_55_9]|nr:MAG: deoxyhypusine synthase [Candidatus Micrarchaeota archaeon CG1_02_55_41]PIO02485.1 MAG: deoxyhypusine synthase [Candidatus Micrarchaeota archaeon CG09_land_8_20_14_0_10_55_25]PIZ91482.1 MAG: deoxyhypusine synthase [Candidatus Micrarchaeota archaeon CG_4_10_14_0_2_um_filter_55_9]PJD00967.1 MAG: deoxyhypusine synthase [Candidatus Micrarchaeota archaeon CG10_big_fil_rev_8_21_14_0_10_54_18]